MACEEAGSLPQAAPVPMVNGAPIPALGYDPCLLGGCLAPMASFKSGCSLTAARGPHYQSPAWVFTTGRGQVLWCRNMTSGSDRLGAWLILLVAQARLGSRGAGRSC